MYAKSVVLLEVLVVVVFVAAAPQKPPVPIVSLKSDINPDGSYDWSYESADGSKQRQIGNQIAPDGGQYALGAVEWYDPAGGYHKLDYVADQDGFKADSDDLIPGPTTPPLIEKALKWIAEHPEKEANA